MKMLNALLIHTARESTLINTVMWLVWMRLQENDYNLNIPRYVDTFEEEEAIDINAIASELKSTGNRNEIHR